jgi:hypothetical protein
MGPRSASPVLHTTRWHFLAKKKKKIALEPGQILSPARDSPVRPVPVSRLNLKPFTPYFPGSRLDLHWLTTRHGHGSPSDHGAPTPRRRLEIPNTACKGEIVYGPLPHTAMSSRRTTEVKIFPCIFRAASTREGKPGTAPSVCTSAHLSSWLKWLAEPDEARTAR